MSGRSVSLCAAIGVVLASCATRPATQVMVFVDAEPGVRDATATVQILVEGSTGRGAADFAQRELSDVAPSWPIRVALAPLDGDVLRVYRVTARALDGAAAVAEVRAISGYRPGETVRIDLVLQDACLHHTPCSVDQTCERGACVPAHIDPTMLQPLDTDAGGRDADALVDAPSDAGSDAPADTSLDVGTDAGSDGGWPAPLEEGTLAASDAAADDQLGYAVAISADGTRALVGAPYDDTIQADAGTVHVYVRTGTTWTEEDVLTPHFPHAGDLFGCAVALSADATRAVIGARGETSASTGDGAAHLFVRIGASWAEETSVFGLGGAFGASVSISADGTRILVGAFNEADGGVGAGTARVFTLSGSSWVEEQVLVPSGSRPFEHFGLSVALSGDGSYALVGAPHDPDGAGSAHVYARAGIVWSEQTQLTAPDALAGDTFGNAVALSADGSRASVGAWNDDIGPIANAGSVHVFVRAGGVWTHEAMVRPAVPSLGELFGTSVALSADGSRMVVGTTVARTFLRTGSAWAEGPLLTASGADFVGRQVALSGDGDRALVGSSTSGSNSGLAHVFFLSWP